MNRPKFLLYSLGLLVLSAGIVWAGQTTLTTYYPSPTGYYNQLYAQNVGIGTTVTPSAALAVMNGNVGIGITAPLYALDINGSVIAGRGGDGAVNVNNPADTDWSYIRFETGGNLNNRWELGRVGGTGADQGSFYLFNGVRGATGRVLTADTNGNVGIGTANPGAPLVIKGPEALGLGQLALIDAANPSTSPTVGVAIAGYGNDIVNGTLTGRVWAIGTGGGSDPSLQINEQLNAGIMFSTNNGQQRMIINSNGNVGIGVTLPSANLHIKGASFNSFGIDYGLIVDPVGGISSGAILIGKTTVGTIPVIQTAFNANLALLPNGGNVGIGTTIPDPAKLMVAGSVSATGSDQNGAQGGNRAFMDMSAGLARLGSLNGGGGNTQTALWSSSAERVRIDANGNVGIGLTAPGALLDVFGSARLANSGNLTVSGLVSCAGVQTSAAGLMSCTSDERLKDIHGSFNEGLSAVTKIHPQVYSWKKDSYLYDGGVRYSGFIAQDVEKAIPEAVNIGSKGYKQVSTTPILAAAVNAIKELDEKVKVQNAQKDKEIAELQKRVAMLEKEIKGPRGQGP